jgi:hypothetical protein
MNNNQKGFSAVEAVIVLIIIGLIGFGGWYVWHSKVNTAKNSTTDGSSVGGKSSSKKPSGQQATVFKEYKNTSVGLSFKYPDTWDLTENLSNIRDLGDEGVISVVSPNGLALHINPNYGGKGGGCLDDPTDVAHNTKSCSTLEIISKEKMTAKSNIAQEENIYLFSVKYTGPRKDDIAPASSYAIYLSNNKQEIDATEPLIGAWFNLGIISNSEGPNIDTFLDGVDLTSSSVLKSDDVKKAADILQSLQILSV